jgi:hypothetical protein
MLDSPEGVCAGQAGLEYPATSVLFSNWVNHLRCHGPPILVSLVADLHRATAVMTSWAGPWPAFPSGRAGCATWCLGGQGGDGGDLGRIEVLPEDPPGPAGAAAGDDLLAGDDQVQAEVVAGLG